MNGKDEMTVKKLDEHVNWRNDDMKDPSVWTMTITSEDQDELGQALAHAKSISHDVLDIGREDFPSAGSRFV